MATAPGSKAYPAACHISTWMIHKSHGSELEHALKTHEPSTSLASSPGRVDRIAKALERVAGYHEATTYHKLLDQDNPWPVVNRIGLNTNPQDSGKSAPIPRTTLLFAHSLAYNASQRMATKEQIVTGLSYYIPREEVSNGDIECVQFGLGEQDKWAFGTAPNTTQIQRLDLPDLTHAFFDNFLMRFPQFKEKFASRGISWLLIAIRADCQGKYVMYGAVQIATGHQLDQLEVACQKVMRMIREWPTKESVIGNHSSFLFNGTRIEFIERESVQVARTIPQMAAQMTARARGDYVSKFDDNGRKLPAGPICMKTDQRHVCIEVPCTFRIGRDQRLEMRDIFNEVLSDVCTSYNIESGWFHKFGITKVDRTAGKMVFGMNFGRECEDKFEKLVRDARNGVVGLSQVPAPAEWKQGSPQFVFEL